jgi:hypothetical protein
MVTPVARVRSMMLRSSNDDDWNMLDADLATTPAAGVL